MDSDTLKDAIAEIIVEYIDEHDELGSCDDVTKGKIIEVLTDTAVGQIELGASMAAFVVSK
jgi:hypothetical protein